MPCYAPNKKIYSKAEITFLKDYYGQIPDTHLLKQLNTMRTEPVKMCALRHQLRRMKLITGVRLIHWTYEQTHFLIHCYKTTGDQEIANELNKMKLSGRDFTRKNIWKKRLLLGLQRTPEEIKAIVADHKKTGVYDIGLQLGRGKKKVTTAEKEPERKTLAMPGQTIKVEIKKGFTIYVKPGTDIAALRAKYAGH